MDVKSLNNLPNRSSSEAVERSREATQGPILKGLRRENGCSQG